MKRVAYILIFISCFFAKAQQASSSHTNISLQNKLSTQVLNAYQENASKKIVDLFQYFELLTDASLNKAVKDEIILNINQTFNDKNPMVIDVTSEELDRIPLQLLIQKLLISQPIHFKISNEKKYSSVTYNNWENEYSIYRTKLGLTKSIAVNQVVFMIKELKEFGAISKEVWVIYLGDLSSVK